MLMSIHVVRTIEVGKNTKTIEEHTREYLNVTERLEAKTKKASTVEDEVLTCEPTATNPK